MVVVVVVPVVKVVGLMRSGFRLGKVVFFCPFLPPTPNSWGLQPGDDLK
jgi:hypothetical protein